MQGKGFFKVRHIVVFQHQRMLHHFLRHACTGGRTKGCQARACLNQQRISMAVVATFKLDDFAAPSCTPRQPNGAHTRLRARANQTHHIHAWHEL